MIAGNYLYNDFSMWFGRNPEIIKHSYWRYKRFLKKYSNRVYRKTDGAERTNKGNTYRRAFDLWWSLL